MKKYIFGVNDVWGIEWARKCQSLNNFLAAGKSKLACPDLLYWLALCTVPNIPLRWSDGTLNQNKHKTFLFMIFFCSVNIRSENILFMLKKCLSKFDIIIILKSYILNSYSHKVKSCARNFKPVKSFCIGTSHTKKVKYAISPIFIILLERATKYVCWLQT